MNTHETDVRLAEYARLPSAARQLVDRLRMRKIPHEGPWFVETYRGDAANADLAATDVSAHRAAYSAIYALITREAFSALHRLQHDELWHFYGGDALELLVLRPAGGGERIVLGPSVLRGEHPQFRVPARTWMAAAPVPGGRHGHALIGNTLSPGFELADYEIGYRHELVVEYPRFTREIVRFTREDSIRRPESAG